MLLSAQPIYEKDVIVDYSDVLINVLLFEKNACFIFLFFFSVRTAPTIGAAVSGLDYSPIDQELNLTSSLLPVCINITLLEDSLIEGNEEFYVELTTTKTRVQIPDRLTQVIIADDGKYFHIFFTASPTKQLHFVKSTTLVQIKKFPDSMSVIFS